MGQLQNAPLRYVAEKWWSPWFKRYWSFCWSLNLLNMWEYWAQLWHRFAGFCHFWWSSWQESLFFYDQTPLWLCRSSPCLESAKFRICMKCGPAGLWRTRRFHRQSHCSQPHWSISGCCTRWNKSDFFFFIRKRGATRAMHIHISQLPIFVFTKLENWLILLMETDGGRIKNSPSGQILDGKDLGQDFGWSLLTNSAYILKLFNFLLFKVCQIFRALAKNPFWRNGQVLLVRWSRVRNHVCVCERGGAGEVFRGHPRAVKGE